MLAPPSLKLRTGTVAPAGLAASLDYARNRPARRLYPEPIEGTTRRASVYLKFTEGLFFAWNV